MKYILLILIFTYSAHTQTIIPLWQNGAPGFEARRDEPEKSKDLWVKNIHNPSITVYAPPASKANGTGILICPGGGHRELVYTAEGVEAANYFNGIGVTAFILKYRLAREENSPYNLDHTKQDVMRAMRLIRSRAHEWNLKPGKLGIIGFSAGGEVAAMVAYYNSHDSLASDPIDRQISKPDFQVLIYPGPGFIPETVPGDAPPAFLLVANDDTGCSAAVMNLLTKYRQANRPIETHIYAQGKHAFNMGLRSKLRTLHSWPDRLTDWMIDNEWIPGKQE